MKALTVLKPQVAEYQEVPKPAAVGRFMTVKVERAGICATDFSIFSGDCSFVRSGEIVYPVRFGHEWSGTVVECGNEVRGFDRATEYTPTAVFPAVNARTVLRDTMTSAALPVPSER